MCTRYISPDQAAIERAWAVDRTNNTPWRGGTVFPRYAGAFLRRGVDPGTRCLVQGQWGLVPWFAKSPTLAYATHNARTEGIAAKASFKQPWLRGQRCVIPAWVYFEPNWETGRNVWWGFKRADRAPWGLAGLWNTWTDQGSGEVVETYTMLTVNADHHPLMRRMHKPDPKLPADAQDKRSVVPIEFADVDHWLNTTVADAQSMLQVPPEAVFEHGPEAAMVNPPTNPSAP